MMTGAPTSVLMPPGVGIGVATWPSLAMATGGAPPQDGFVPGPEGGGAGGAPMQPVGRKVLVVDDEPAVLRAIARGLWISLGLEKADLFNAGNVDEALAVYAGHRDSIAAVVTDIDMPRGSGFDLYRALRETHRFTGPIVMWSGQDHTEEFAAISGDPKVRMFGKPVKVEEIADWIRSQW